MWVRLNYNQAIHDIILKNHPVFGYGADKNQYRHYMFFE
jgi:hypothetical protein